MRLLLYIKVFMIYIFLIVTGICFGSFINALIWRIHFQSKRGNKNNPNLSIVHGRSMCMHCKHTLLYYDLIPIISWVMLKGRCRYCHHKYPDSPISEILTPSLFVFSYVFWPMIFDAKGTILFILWLIYLIGFIALGLYDLKWYLLPNRIIFPLYIVAFVQITVLVLFFDLGMQGLLTQIGAILIGGGIFYILYQISNGKWIGGGDVKLGFLIGAILGKPMLSILFIFIASLVGTLFAVPLLIRGSLKRSSHLPFGPFLLISAFIVVLFGDSLANGYLRIVGL